MKNLLLILTFIIITTSVHAQKKVTLQLSWLNQFQFAGYYMAKEMGYYEDVGLDVQIKEFQFGMNALSMLENKKNDFAIGRSSLLIDKSKGKDIVALAALYQQSPLMLLVTKDSKIETIEDLKNKKIMITADAEASASIISMLSSNGINMKDIKVLKHSFNVDDLISGKTDAMASYISNEPIVLDEKGIDYKIFHPKNYGFQFYGDILFTSSEFIYKNPQLTKDFYHASMKGWEYAFNNIGKTSEVIHDKYNSQKKTKIQFVKEAEVLKSLAYTGDNNEIGSLDKDTLAKIVNAYKVLGLITSDVNLNEFVYEYNNHTVFKLHLTKNDLFVVILIGSIIFIILIFLIISTSNKHKWLRINKQLQEDNSNAKEEIAVYKDSIKNQYNKLNMVMDNSNEIVVFKNENLNYIECNNYFAKLFTKKKEDIIGKNDFYLFDEEIATLLGETDRKVIQSKKSEIIVDWFNFPLIGEKHLFKLYIQAFEYEKGKIGVVIFSRDITEENDLEEKNLQNRKSTSVEFTSKVLIE